MGKKSTAAPQAAAHASSLKPAFRHAYASVTEAASAWGLGRDSIYDAIRDGKLKARKLGKRTVITNEAMERFVSTLPIMKLPPAPQREAA